MAIGEARSPCDAAGRRRGSRSAPASNSSCSASASEVRRASARSWSRRCSRAARASPIGLPRSCHSRPASSAIVADGGLLGGRLQQQRLGDGRAVLVGLRRARTASAARAMASSRRPRRRATQPAAARAWGIDTAVLDGDRPARPRSAAAVGSSATSALASPISAGTRPCTSPRRSASSIAWR